MKRFANQLVAALVALLIVFSCGPKEEPSPALPAYLRVPTSLDKYAGSGLLTVSGDLSLKAEGPEVLDPATKTYSGVLGTISTDDLVAQFTAGQPLPYGQSSTVLADYRANGVLRVFNTTQPGTYPMGLDARPTPTGVITDLVLNLPGPQLYYARSGSLTITESTLIKAEGSLQLYRIQGTFQTVLDASGVGVTPGKPITATGTFDLLLLSA